jgi:hypothetical protein
MLVSVETCVGDEEIINIMTICIVLFLPKEAEVFG